MKRRPALRLRRLAAPRASAGRRPLRAQLERWLVAYDTAWLVLHNTIPDFENSTTERWLNRWAFWSAQQWVDNQRAVAYLLPVDDAPLATLRRPNCVLVTPRRCYTPKRGAAGTKITRWWN